MRTLERLEQLSRYVRQLCQCDERKDLDVTALSRSLQEQLSALQESPLLPDGRGSTTIEEEAHRSGREEVLNALRGLLVETRECIQVLTGSLNRTEAELSSMRSTNKALNAYRHRR
jgi:hypothetical protein